MSLQTDGVWKGAVWAATVWAAGVWFEGATPGPAPSPAPQTSITYWDSALIAGRKRKRLNRRLLLLG
jgi:hypothetical protein